MDKIFLLVLLILREERDMDVSSIYLIGAFFLGVFHGLEPGHGKTVVAAYLVGSEGKIRDAVILGVIVTFTHTISVIILGLVCTLLGTNKIPSLIEHSLGLLCGGLIIMIGLGMLISKSRNLNDTHYHENLNKRQGLFQLTTLGISGGIIPCPAAIALLLTAIGSGYLTKGLILVLLFSLGLAMVLISLGIIVCKTKSFIGKHTKHKRITITIPLFSSLLIIILGIFILTQSIYASKYHYSTY